MVRPHSDLWRIADVVGATRSHPRGSLGHGAARRRRSSPRRPRSSFTWPGTASAPATGTTRVRSIRTSPAPCSWCESRSAVGCRCWIGVGSQAEYGPFEGSLHEDQPTRPVTMYGVTKLCAGMLTAQLCSADRACAIVWVSLAGHVWAEDDRSHFIPIVTRTLLRGGEARADGRRSALGLSLRRRRRRCPVPPRVATPRAEGVFNLGSGRVA